MNFTVQSLNQKVKETNGCKEGCLTWSEFLDLFFLQDIEDDQFDLPPVRIEGWWT